MKNKTHSLAIKKRNHYREIVTNNLNKIAKIKSQIYHCFILGDGDSTQILFKRLKWAKQRHLYYSKQLHMMNILCKKVN
jgi:hypothetical protein